MKKKLMKKLVASLPVEYRLLLEVSAMVERLEVSLGDMTAETRELLDRVVTLEAQVERIKVIEGALEETINRVEELRPPATTKPKPEPTLYTASGRRSQASKFKGVYCRNCAKVLAERQVVFCSRKCAKHWRDQHPGEVPQPRLTIEEALEATVVAGVGVRDNGKERETVEA